MGGAGEVLFVPVETADAASFEVVVGAGRRRQLQSKVPLGGLGLARDGVRGEKVVGRVAGGHEVGGMAVDSGV